MVSNVFIIHLLSTRLNYFVVYINYHVTDTITYVPYLNSYLIMGIRLFPHTDNNACLAELINVPHDTFDRLRYIEEQYQGEAKEATKWPENDWYEMFRNHIKGHEELEKAHEFRVSGWGYFDLKYLDSDDDCCAGEITDPVLAQKIFDSAHNKELSNHIDFERVSQLSHVLCYS